MAWYTPPGDYERQYGATAAAATAAKEEGKIASVKEEVEGEDMSGTRSVFGESMVDLSFSQNSSTGPS